MSGIQHGGPGFKLRKVATPLLPDPPPAPAAVIPAWDLTLAHSSTTPADAGQLQPIAAQILMKTLSAARVARLDLLRAVNFLAAQITKRTPRCSLSGWIDLLVTYGPRCL